MEAAKAPLMSKDKKEAMADAAAMETQDASGNDPLANVHEVVPGASPKSDEVMGFIHELRKNQEKIINTIEKLSDKVSKMKEEQRDEPPAKPKQVKKVTPVKSSGDSSGNDEARKPKFTQIHNHHQSLRKQHKRPVIAKSG
jgi:hypothetical protein